jgi:hypothetical protein
MSSLFHLVTWMTWCSPSPLLHNPARFGFLFLAINLVQLVSSMDEHVSSEPDACIQYMQWMSLFCSLLWLSAITVSQAFGHRMAWSSRKEWLYDVWPWAIVIVCISESNIVWKATTLVAPNSLCSPVAFALSCVCVFVDPRIVFSISGKHR